MALGIETVAATRIIITGVEYYSEASRLAYTQAVLQLGTGSLNLADCTKRLRDNAFLFTYTVITPETMGATT